jgi:hypothetical protein
MIHAPSRIIETGTSQKLGTVKEIISADKEHYHMVSYHEKGENKYEFKGPRGRVTPISE